MKFEYYVLNERNNEIISYNIFNNIHVQQGFEKEIKKYLRSPSKYKYNLYVDNSVETGFEGLCEACRGILMWQEWSRCEYEIVVKPLFSTSEVNERKLDCYEQAEPNMEMIVRECIYQYKKQLKEQEKDNE